MKRVSFPAFLVAVSLVSALPGRAEEPRKVVPPGEGDTVVAVPPAATPEPTPAPPAIAPTVIPASPVPTASEVAAQDRRFLESSEGSGGEAGEAAEENGSEPLLRGGPYETAASHVQAEVFRRAESILRRHGLLEPEGASEADLEEAIFRYQSAERIPLTGRLDETTLITMRLMPRNEVPRDDERVERGRPVEVFRGRVPRSRTAPGPGVVRGIPLE